MEPATVSPAPVCSETPAEATDELCPLITLTRPEEPSVESADWISIDPEAALKEPDAEAIKILPPVDKADVPPVRSILPPWASSVGPDTINTPPP